MLACRARLTHLAGRREILRAVQAEQCRSAVLGLGMQPPERLQNLLRVSVAVLGGSISCGSYVPNGIARRRITRAMVGATSKSLRGGGFENAWPAALQILLAARWGLPVTVHNLCERARGSDHWSATVASSSASGGANATSRSFAHLLNGADVVIVEAASNDMADYTTAGREADSATSFTELLAHQLLALPQQPWLLWLTAGWLQSLHVTGAEHRRVGWPLHGNARTLACRKLDLLWTPTITVPRAEFIVMPARANTSTLAPKALRRGRYNTQTAACTWLSLVVVS